MKVLSPACFTQKPLFWQPPHAVRQKRILSERDKRAQLLWLVVFTTGTFSSPSTMVPLGEESFPWETSPGRAASCVFPLPCADHACSASQPVPHICFSSSCTDWGLRAVQSVILSWAHTLRRQQLSSSLFLALLMVLRCSIQTLNCPLHCSQPRLLQGQETSRLQMLLYWEGDLAISKFF